MKLIIDIPEEKYKWIKAHNLNIDNDSIVGAVANGTPYEDRPKGKWIKIDPDKRGFTDLFKCSVCLCNVRKGYYVKECEYDYCPNCGAKMRGGHS